MSQTDPPPNPYHVLGLSRSASPKEIDTAYARAFKAARRGETRYAPEQVNAAREALEDPDERLAWDVVTFNVPLDEERIGALMRFEGPYAQAGLRLELWPEDIEPLLPPVSLPSREELLALAADALRLPDDEVYRRALRRVAEEMLEPWPEEA